jgi:hypothetical protein
MFALMVIPCDSFPTLSLTFSGKAFEIPPEVLRLKPLKEGSPNCFSALVAERSPVGEISYHFLKPLLRR